jgi:2-oxoglutarate dehydrogenase E2 component (dihydrolipoamide succinyltransferase)
MADVRVPKLNNNDESYTLVEWLAPDGSLVGTGEALVSLETSKAVEELASTESGILRHGVSAGTQCAPSAVIGRIAAPGSSEADTAARTAAAPPEPAPADGPVITEPARELMNAQGIGVEDVRALGIKIVRRSDIEAMAAKDEAGPATSACELPPVQRAVARAVTQSHATIPAAYTVVQVDVGAAQREAKQLTRAHRVLVGLPEFLIAAVSRLPGSFPVLFASPAGANALNLAADAHIGVTIDVGKGLYVPVVRHASQRTLNEIAQIMAGFRRTAMEGRFSEQDLSGGNIIITLHTDLDVVLAIPIIFPGQTSALALASPRRIVVPGDEDSVTTRVVANLGLAYDHRFINGREAMAFLRGTKALLESPGQLLP